MKNRVTRFKNLAVALEELRPFIRNAEHLQTGRPFKQLDGMLSREALANWLICVTGNYECGMDRFSFTTDPTGGDGVIYDDQSSKMWRMEHVMVPETRPEDRANARDAEAAVLAAIDCKRQKGGAAYASGKQLVVFLNKGSGLPWVPNRVAKQLPKPLLFDSVWIVGLHQFAKGRYTYAVTQPDAQNGHAQVWLVRIGADFASWNVDKIQ